MSETDIKRPEVVFLLPGLGGTSDMFADYQLPFPTHAVEYSAPHAQDMGFSEYAIQLIDEHGIRPGDSLIGQFYRYYLTPVSFKDKNYPHSLNYSTNRILFSSNLLS